MKKTWCSLLLLLLPVLASAKKIPLMEIVLKDYKSQYTYYAEINQNCQFHKKKEIEAVKETVNPFFFFKEQIGLFEGFYFKITEAKIENHQLSFKIQSAKNFTFHFKLKKKNKKCIVDDKKITMNDQTYSFKRIYLDIKHNLLVPTLKFLEIKLEKNGDKRSSLFYPWHLDGYLPFHEAHLGFGLNIHSQVRPNETRKFNTGNPVVEPIPTFFLRYGPFYANRDGFGIALIPTRNFLLLANFVYDGEPYHTTGLDERKRSFFFGPLLKIHFLEILFLRDIQGRSNGESLKIFLAPEFKAWRKWLISPRFWYQYWDGDYVDYYYGVDPEELNSNFSVYQGTQTSNLGFMLRNVFRFDRFQFLLSAGLKIYGQQVVESPLQTKRKEWRLITGFLYQIL